MPQVLLGQNFAVADLFALYEAKMAQQASVDPDELTGCADDFLPGSAEDWRTVAQPKTAAEVIAEAIFPASFNASDRVSEMAACGDTVARNRRAKIMAAQLAVDALAKAGLLK